MADESQPDEQEQQYEQQLSEEKRTAKKGAMEGEAEKRVGKLRRLVGKGMGAPPEYSPAMWIILLVLAIAKDSLDLSTLGFLDIVDWAVDIALSAGIFYAATRSGFSIQKRIIVAGITWLSETFLGFVPTNTISVLYLMWKAKSG